MINKIEIIKELKRLNDSELIKIDGTDKERLIFKNSDEMFKLFGTEEKGVLTPFNDYTYNWLSSFLDNVISQLENTNTETLEKFKEEVEELIYEWVDSEVDIYTYDLTKWLADNINNVNYLDDAIKEDSHNVNSNIGVSILQIAQYKAIEELFNNALPLLIEHLKEKFGDD